MSVAFTRTVQKKDQAVSQERPYDHLYDPVYTVSSEVDHARSSLKAYANNGRIRRVPVFGSMFSNLPHHPRYNLQLESSDPVPPWIDRRWRGRTEQRKEALQQQAGYLPHRVITNARLERESCQVTGADHWKYSKCPLIPFSQQVPPDSFFTLPKEDFESIGVKRSEQQPSHFTVGVQTDYRESETQTDPYSPEYVVQRGATPSELLQLAAFTWGRGLPAGLAEVEMIQRARARRDWEASLPPLDDLSQLDKRRRMMEEKEAEEWAYREKEIEKLQEIRLAVLKDLLKQREETRNEITGKRLNQIYSKLLKDKEIKQCKTHNDYVRSLRKLEAKRRNFRKGHGRIGNIKRYSGSYAFPTSRHTSSNEFKSHYLDTYEGLQELEVKLSAPVLKPQLEKPKVKTTKAEIESPVSRAVQLLQKYQALKEEKERAQRTLRLQQKLAKPIPRPETPKVEEPPEEDEVAELTVELQKLLRGRSVQIEISIGKENRMELIQELRTVHALQPEEQELQKADKELTLTQKTQRDKLKHKTSQKLASQAGAVGAELEHLFDTLSKDLIHLQEERRIHAFTLLAERDRRLREAEESGRRHVEERRRREEDEIFRQVVQIHQDTLDLYLEDIILNTVEKTADQQAREEIHRMAKEVNDVAYAMEESLNNLQSEEIVSELTYSFLIPEAEKITARQRVQQKQLRHLQAARSIIQGTAENSGFLLSVQGASQMTCASERAANQVFEEMFNQEEQEKGKEEAMQHHTPTE